MGQHVHETKSTFGFLATTACTRESAFTHVYGQYLKCRHELLTERGYASSRRRHKKFHWTGIAPWERKGGNEEEEEEEKEEEEVEEEEQVEEEGEKD